MQIDEAGRYYQTLGLNLFAANARNLTDCGNGITVDGNVTLVEFTARTICDGAIANN